MHFNPAIISRPRIIAQSLPRRAKAARPACIGSEQASAEIHAYIAARDMALAEAELRTSDTTLNRAFLANQLVENCLQPVRSPYEAQCLPEAEAARERARCQSATVRISALRAGAAVPLYACAVAA